MRRPVCKNLFSQPYTNPTQHDQLPPLFGMGTIGRVINMMTWAGSNNFKFHYFDNGLRPYIKVLNDALSAIFL